MPSAAWSTPCAKLTLNMEALVAVSMVVLEELAPFGWLMEFVSATPDEWLENPVMPESLELYV